MTLLDFLIELDDRGVTDMFRNGNLLVPVVYARNPRRAMKKIKAAERWIRSVMTPELRRQLLPRLLTMSGVCPHGSILVKGGK